MVQEMDSNPVPEPEGEVTSFASPDKDVAQGYSFKILQQALAYDDYGKCHGPWGCHLCLGRGEGHHTPMHRRGDITTHTCTGKH